jgi:hypothetical protein
MEVFAFLQLYEKQIQIQHFVSLNWQDVTSSSRTQKSKKHKPYYY